MGVAQMSEQTRLVSLIEVVTNVAIGFVVSALAWPFVATAMGYPLSVSHTVYVTSFYTVLSITRGYIIRRFFARGLHNTAVRIARRWANGSR